MCKLKLLKYPPIKTFFCCLKRITYYYLFLFFKYFFRKEQPLEDPKFIVTLDGINSSYFKKDTADKVKISMNNKPAAIIAPMKHIAEIDTNKDTNKKSSSSSTPTVSST